MSRALSESVSAIYCNHPPPKRHGARVAQVFNDLPITREAVEDQRCCVAAHADPAMLLAYEELGHSIVRGGLAGNRNSRPRHQREANRFGSFEDHEGMRVIVGKPMGEDLVFTRIV